MSLGPSTGNPELNSAQASLSDANFAGLCDGLKVSAEQGEEVGRRYDEVGYRCNVLRGHGREPGHFEFDEE